MNQVIHRHSQNANLGVVVAAGGDGTFKCGSIKT